MAQRILKPGGSLVTFIGHYAVFEINDLIKKNSDLIFHWPIVVVHSGHIRRMDAWRVWPYHKPLLWYYKPVEGNGNGHGPTMYQDVADVIPSKAPLKDDHEWEQSTVEAEHMIKPLTVKGNVILDPFMGSGTTLEAAYNLHRRSIGMDNDKVSYSRAMRRLTKLQPKITISQN